MGKIKASIEKLGSSNFVTGLARAVLFTVAPLSATLGGWMLATLYAHGGDITKVEQGIAGIKDLLTLAIADNNKTNDDQSARIGKLESILMNRPTKAADITP